MLQHSAAFAPSPGTPGEGWVEGLFLRPVAQGPHPYPLPEYRARESDPPLVQYSLANDELPEIRNCRLKQRLHQTAPASWARSPTANPRIVREAVCKSPK